MAYLFYIINFVRMYQLSFPSRKVQIKFFLFEFIITMNTKQGFQLNMVRLECQKCLRYKNKFFLNFVYILYMYIIFKLRHI